MSNINIKDSVLYKKLYNEMTSGDASKMYAMSAGTMGRHTERRNNLAANIAVSITKYYLIQDTLATVPIDQVVKALKYKLSGFASRKQTSEAFGFKGTKDGTIIEDYNQQMRFVKDVVELSYPLSQRFYEELTTGDSTSIGYAMHGGSRTAKALAAAMFFVPMAVANFNKYDLSTRNSLATNISIAIQEKVRQKQDTDTDVQINEGIHATNMLLYSFKTRNNFADYYHKYREHFVSSISESLVENEKLKASVVYQIFYMKMTEGNISKMDAMHGGMIGIHKQYQEHLAENIALSIARDCSEQQITEITLNDMVRKLELKLLSFLSRDETCKAFGWQESWLENNVINNKTQHKEFISEISGLCAQNSCHMGIELDPCVKNDFSCD